MSDDGPLGSGTDLNLSPGFRIVPAGDSAVLVEFPPRIDADVNARVVALSAALQALSLSGVRDVVPTFRSVAIYFDPLRTDVVALTALIESEVASREPGRITTGAHVRIPVCYGAGCGADLPDVAAFAGTTEADVIRIHSARAYRVFMIGFVPGFAYMGVVDDAIAMPRLATPRVRVPAGSVGIAGKQTGVYPAATPGGWRLIGRTPISLFDAGRVAPAALHAGDTVEFYPMARDDYDRTRGGAA